MFDKKYFYDNGWYVHTELKDGSIIYEQEVDEFCKRYSILKDDQFSCIHDAYVKKLIKLNRYGLLHK
jgi:hypothetical protein